LTSSVTDGVLDATDGMGWDERRNADGCPVEYGDYDYNQARSLQMNLITGINVRLASQGYANQIAGRSLYSTLD
tara:strand:+ start:2784 stop:3005 length:222 start_codon:yes stop_codon:yes gene_type:complete